MIEHYQITDEKIKELEKRIEMLEQLYLYNKINVSMLKNKIKDLSERFENVEKQMKEDSERLENFEKQTKEDREEQLNKVKAELDYAKFSCALPIITDMIRNDN